MINNKTLIHIILIVVFLGSCTKEHRHTEKPATTESDMLQVLWQTPIVPEPISSHFTISMNPCLLDSQVVFGSEYTLQNISAPILFLDTATGKIENTWADYGFGNSLYHSDATVQFGNYLCLSTQRSIDCVDLKTSQSLWSKSISKNSPYIYANQGFIYSSHGSPNDKTCTIIRSPLESNRFETIYTFSSNSIANPWFDAFGFGKLSNGDDILVCKNRKWGSGTTGTDILAFNLTADTLLWINTDIQEVSGINPLQVENERVYGLARKHAFCIDLRNGKLIWSQKLAQMTAQEWGMGFDGRDFHLRDQEMLIKGNHGKILFLFKGNGALHKEATGLPQELEDRMTYFESKLFFAAGEELVIASAASGEQLLNEVQARQFDNIQSKILIDPNRRVMYFHDGRYAYCVKIPNNL